MTFNKWYKHNIKLMDGDFLINIRIYKNNNPFDEYICNFKYLDFHKDKLKRYKYHKIKKITYSDNKLSILLY